jgi:hypothetical protein
MVGTSFEAEYLFISFGSILKDLHHAKLFSHSYLASTSNFVIFSGTLVSMLGIILDIRGNIIIKLYQ